MSTRTQVNPFFTPTQISGCSLWLDGADPNGTGILPVNNGTVSTWADKSGRANNGTTAAGRLPYSTQSRGVVFNGSSYYSVPNNTFPTGNTNYSLFIVASTGLANYYWLVGAGSTSTGQAIGYVTYPDGAIENGWWLSGITTGAGAVLANQTTMLECVYSSPTLTTLVNGTSKASSSSVGTRNSGGANNVIGTRPDSNPGSIIQAFVGVMNEVILFASGVSLSQRQQVEGYLAWKWGLQANLPANHPYKSSPIAPLLNPPTTRPLFLPNTTSTFSPLQIPGCRVWLDGTDVNANGTSTANNASISTWKDKSGFSYDFTASVAATYNSSIQAVVFNNSYYTSSYPANPTNETAFLVFMITTTNKPQIIVGTNGGGRELALYNDGSQFGLINSQTGWGAIVGTIVLNTPFLATGQISGGTSSYISLNGSLTLTGPTSIPAFTNGITTGLGREAGNSLPFYGNMYELVIFNSVLGVAQRQQMEGYLSWKWSNQSRLPLAHPYKNNAPFIPSLAFPARSIVSFATWQPTQISGCSLWLDAADTSSLTLVGNTVTGWADKSGNSRNGVATGLPQLGKTTTGKQAIVFSGTDYFRITNNISTFTRTNMSLFIVASATSGTRNLIHLFGNERIISYQLYYNNMVGFFFFTPSNPFLNSNTTCCIVEDVGVRCIGYINGSVSGSQASAAITNAATDIVVGAHGNLTNAWIGNIQEVVIYNSALTTPQRQQVEGYLAWKWGTQASLPSNHPWKLWPPPP